MSALDISGITEVKAMIAELGGEFQTAGRYAQNAMAYDVMQAEKEQMRTDLDRPTAWSLGALRYKRADGPEKPAPPPGVIEPKVQGAAVYMIDFFSTESKVDPEAWLGVQIVGGKTAGPRRSENTLRMYGWIPPGKVWVPAVGAPRNASGDVPGSLISDMLTNLGANPYGKKARGTTETKYVLIGEPGKEEGVWRLVGGAWQPFLWFVDPADSRPRWDFYGRADREIRLKFQGYLERYLDIALQKLAAR